MNKKELIGFIALSMIIGLLIGFNLGVYYVMNKVVNMVYTFSGIQINTALLEKALNLYNSKSLGVIQNASIRFDERTED